MSSKKLNSIITINFDTLIDIIENLQNKNEALTNKMQDVMSKMTSLSDFNEDIDNLKYKTNSVFTKMTNVEQSIDNYSKKFMDIEKRMQQMDAKMEKSEGKNKDKDKTLQEIEERVIGHENNINNLNRVVEENVKTSDKEKEKSIKLTEELQSFDAKISLREEEIKSLRSSTIENVKRLELIYEAHDTTSKDLEARLNKKLHECEKRMNLIIDKMNQLHNLDNHPHHHSHNPTPKNEGTVENADNTILSNEANNQSIEQRKSLIKSKEEEGEKEDQERKPRRLSIITSEEQYKTEETLRIDEVVREIAKIQATMESIRLESSKLKESTEEDFANIKKKISSMNNPMDHLPDFNFINQSNNQLAHANNTIIHEEIRTQKQPVLISNPDLDLNDNTTEDNSKDKQLILDHIKLLSYSIDNKVTKEDFASSNQNLLNEIDSLSHKLNESLHQYDTKLKLIANISKGSGPGIDPEALTQTLNAQIVHVLKASAKEMVQNQIPQIDLSQNEHFNQTILTMQNHTEELNKTYESIVDIRNNLLSKQVEDHVSSLLGRMTEVETGFRKVKFDVDELTKSLEDDLNIEPKEGDNNNSKSLATQVSLRETVNILTSKLITINDKVEKLDKKQSEIHKNILIIVKQDLKTESNRILEEFKSDLKISIAKIEDQLREKVDKFNLVEFSQRIDSKFISEIKKKLDRVDLNKNNSIINRKIDSLEDKISKQLVDTLIDLQLEEAPLIVKKTMKSYDKCASCNQTLPQRNNHYVSTSTEANNYSKYKNAKNSVKDKLPEINTNF